jgi:hypothetical protein
MAEQRRKEKDPARITLKNVRLSHPHVFTARAFGRPRNGETAKPAYSATALVDMKRESLIDKIWDAVDAAKEKAFPGKDPRDIKIKKANMALFEGDNPGEDVDVKEEQKGMLVVRARNYKRPLVLDQDGEELRESDNVIYGGCYVDMIVQFWAQDYEGTKRLNCSIEGVRFRDDGDPFGAGPLDPSEFDEGEDDGGSRRSSSRGRDKDDDDDRGSRRGGGRSRGDDDDDRGTSRRRGDDDDDKGSRRGRDDDDRGSRRGRDEDEDRGSSRRRGDDDDDRGTSRRRGDDDDDRGSRRGRDEDEDRGSSRRRGDDDEDRGSSRRRGDDDDDKGSRRGRGDDDDRGSSRRRGEEDEDRGSSRRRGRDEEDEDRGSSRRRGREDLS